MKKKLKRQRNNQGITLVALIITMVVLLILTSISVATLTGNNGVLTKTSESKIKTEEK